MYYLTPAKTRETKAKKCTYFNYQEVLTTKNYSWNRGEARPLTVLFNTGNNSRMNKTKEGRGGRGASALCGESASLSLFPSVQKDSAKENFQTASISWGRSLRSVPNTNDGFDCLPLRFPEFSCLKKMEWGKEGSRKQANKQCIVAFWQDFVQPRKWTGIFLSCWIHFYKVSFWNPQKTHMKCLFNRISRKCDHFIVESGQCSVLNFWFNFKENVQLNHSVFLELNFDLFNIC